MAKFSVATKMRSTLREWARALYYLLQNGKRSDNLSFKEIVIVGTPYVSQIVDAIAFALSGQFVVRTQGHISKWNSNELYIVLCPQFFGRLPPKRVVYNFEQAPNLKYFTVANRLMFERSIGILDYSRENLLRQWPNLSDRCTVLQPGICRRQLGPSPKSQKKFDLVFFGTINDRRKKLLRDLEQEFTVAVVQNAIGVDLEAIMMEAKACINLHLFDSSPFESTRFLQCLSINLPMISETSTDQEDFCAYGQFLKFVDLAGSPNAILNVRRVLDSLEIDNDGFVDMIAYSEQKFCMDFFTSMKILGVDLGDYRPDVSLKSGVNI